MGKFFEEFDEVTKVKLDLFRYYIREWLAVFMTDKNFRHFAMLDYFCGPGRDEQGNVGTPLIILEEIQKYLDERQNTLNKQCKAIIYFNDKDPQNIEQLEENLRKIEDPENFTIRLRGNCLEFQEALKETGKILEDPSIPCLALMDQFGLKEVEKETFQKFVKFPKTDILFFITSGNIKRFASVPSIAQRFPEGSLLKNLSREFVHEGVTEFFRSWIPKGEEYYLAPFTLKRGSNIYGVIFGSHSLRGLEKFLISAWRLDPQAGASNANIFHDIPSEQGQLTLFSEEPSNKEYDYQQRLWEYLSEERTNLDLYKFGLICGFLPKQTSQFLKEFQNEGKIEVTSISDGTKPRKGTFYISWENYQSNVAKIRIKRR